MSTVTLKHCDPPSPPFEKSWLRPWAAILIADIKARIVYVYIVSIIVISIYTITVLHALYNFSCSFPEQKAKKQTAVLPGLDAVIPHITYGELKTPYIILLDDMPHMTLQSALWHSTPVTVKRFKRQEDSRQLLLKEADLLRSVSFSM